MSRQTIQVDYRIDRIADDRVSILSSLTDDDDAVLPGFTRVSLVADVPDDIQTGHEIAEFVTGVLKRHLLQEE